MACAFAIELLFVRRTGLGVACRSSFHFKLRQASLSCAQPLELVGTSNAVRVLVAKANNTGRASLSLPASGLLSWWKVLGKWTT